MCVAKQHPTKSQRLDSTIIMAKERQNYYQHQQYVAFSRISNYATKY